MSLVIALTTIDSLEKAENLAHTLVEERLAACVNIIPSLRSVYRWQGKVQEESECLLVLKTTSDKTTSLQDRLVALHPYDTPEFVVLEATHVSEKYLQWANT
jgi:periplasmic divalent cation tolerance protein